MGGVESPPDSLRLSRRNEREREPVPYNTGGYDVDETQHSQTCLGDRPDGYFGGSLLPLVVEQILGRRGFVAGRQGCYFHGTAFGGNSGPGSSREQQCDGQCLHQQPRGIFIPGVVRLVCRFLFYRHRSSRFRTDQARSRHAFCRENGAARLHVAVSPAVNHGRDGVRNRGRLARQR